MPTGNLQLVPTVGQTQMRVSGSGGRVGRYTAGGGCPAEAAACGAEQSMGEQETGPKDSGPCSDSLL